jgi:glycosyltransferase involved in cell wall biosynthesis
MPLPGRLRVLFLPSYATSNPYQRELARALRDRGVRVVYAGAPPHHPLPILSGWVRRHRPRVVHLHWTHQYLGGAEVTPGRLHRARFLGQLRLLRWLGVRLVWTIHNVGSHEGDRSPVEMAVHRRLFELCDAVICHCEAAAKSAAEAYELDPELRRRLHVIPHGNYIGVYPNTVSRSEARSRLGLPADARVLLFIGAVRAYKGLEELLAAFRTLDEPDVRLVLAGSPRRPSDAVRVVAAAAGDSRVTVRLEFIPEGELQVLLNAADVVVLPFRDVLTSGSMVLAMSFGRAIVAPSMGCLPDTLAADGGVLYDPDDPKGLVTALRTALTADLEAMGARNLDRARELDWGPIAEATAQLYRA